MYGDNDKYVKAHASDDQDDLRCETLSEGALCKEAEAQKPKTFWVAIFHLQKFSGRSAQNRFSRQA